MTNLVVSPLVGDGRLTAVVIQYFRRLKSALIEFVINYGLKSVAWFAFGRVINYGLKFVAWMTYFALTKIK